MIDVVYAVGNGSHWQDNELRYSLRSVEKYLTNYRKVYIVGHRPSLLNLDSVIHIPFDDKHSHERNIMEKVKHACKYPGLSDQFLFMNDDHYLLTQFDAIRFPYYYSGTLDQKMIRARGAYSESVHNTLIALKRRRKPRNNFDVHTPIVLDKIRFPIAMDEVDWNKRNGYVIKSLYCGMNRIKGIQIEDGKPLKEMSVHALDKWLSDRFVFSTPDKVTNEMRSYLDYRFPDKSKFEI